MHAPGATRSVDDRTSRLTLRFRDPLLEADYRADWARQSLGPLRVLLGALAGLGLLGGAFAQLDAPFSPELWAPATLEEFQRRLTLVDLGYVLGVSLVVLALSRTAWARARLQAVMAAFFLGLVLAAFHPLVLASRDITRFAFPALVLLLLVVPLLGRLRFVWASACTALLLLSFVVGAAGILEWPLAELPLQGFFALLATALGMVGSYQRERLSRREFVRSRELREERARSEALLLNVLPATIAERLKAGEEPIADSHEEVTILFADIAGFTPLAERMTPESLVRLLDGLFRAFDGIVERHGLEKIKTIGDAYMAVAGLAPERGSHASAAAAAALELRAATKRYAAGVGSDLRLRIGLHTGPVTAGVIGKSRLLFDLWGDAVNVAARMESHAPVGAIQLTEAVRARLDDRFVVEPRGAIEVKGKGTIVTYLLAGGAADQA